MSKNQHHGGKSGHDDHEDRHEMEHKDVKPKGKNGDDVLTGTEGNDKLFGGKGDDVANFTLSENLGAHDVYDGGKGFDTLQLTLTSDELKAASADIAAFEAFLASKENPCSDDGRPFEFLSFDLDVRNFEALKIVEIGGNAAPVATADSFTTDEDIPVDNGNALFNDTDVEDGRPALVSAVNGSAENVGKMITLDSGALLTVEADGSFIYDPSGKFESLGAGQSALEIASRMSPPTRWARSAMPPPSVSPLRA